MCTFEHERTKGRTKDISPEYSSEKRSNRVEPGDLSEEASGEGEGGQVLEAGGPSLGTRCINFTSHSLLAEANQLLSSWKTKIK
jgi:hypothetical protein